LAVKAREEVTMCDPTSQSLGYTAGLRGICLGYLGVRRAKQVKIIEIAPVMANNGKAGASVSSDHHAFKECLRHASDQRFKRWSVLLEKGLAIGGATS